MLEPGLGMFLWDEGRHVTAFCALKSCKKGNKLFSLSGEGWVAKGRFEILQQGRCWSGEACGEREDQPLSRGRLGMLITGGFGEEGGQKSARAGRRP